MNRFLQKITKKAEKTTGILLNYLAAACKRCLFRHQGVAAILGMFLEALRLPAVLCCKKHKEQLFKLFYWMQQPDLSRNSTDGSWERKRISWVANCEVKTMSWKELKCSTGLRGTAESGDNWYIFVNYFHLTVLKRWLWAPHFVKQVFHF